MLSVLCMAMYVTVINLGMHNVDEFTPPNWINGHHIQSTPNGPQSTLKQHTVYAERHISYAGRHTAGRCIRQGKPNGVSVRPASGRS